jgi:hypothetical protein
MNFYERAFSGGEIAPALYGRVDLAKYGTGVRTMRNFFVGRTGGAYNRPGTKYCATAQDPTNTVRLKKFTTQNGYEYLLEFGNNYLRILDQGQPILSQAVSLTGYIANGTTTTTLIGAQAFGFVVGDNITFTLVGSGGSVTNQAATVTAVPSAFQATVSFNSSSFGIFSSGQASLVTQRVITYQTPWPSAVLRQLTFTQDQNVLTIVQQSVYPQTLTYLGRQAWSFGNVSMVPKTTTPGTITVNPATAGASFFWGVTAIDADTLEESFVSTVGNANAPTSSTPITISWAAVPNAVEYNIYAGSTSQTLGFRTVVYTNMFLDNGSLFIDYTDPPPIARGFFTAPGTTPSSSALPAAVGTFQQRRWYGNIGPVLEYPPTILPPTAPAADRIIGSRIGSPTFFAINRPVSDDDAISFRLAHKNPQRVRHFLDLGKLLVFTEQGEWVIAGGDSGITPKDINPTCVSQNGSGDLAPLQIGNVAIYRQLKGSMIRTFGYEFQVEGYRGDDLTVFSSHLVDQHQVLAWDYQKIPHPIIWMAREDGIVLGLTFVPEQNLVAWHRHDFQNGFVEDVCQSDDRIYFVIRRVINGVTTRYIERLHNRIVQPITKSIFLDSSLTYDGTINALTTAFQLSGGVTWGPGEPITITATGYTFTPTTLPGAIHLTGPDGTFVRFTNLTFVSSTQVTAMASRLVPTTMRNIQIQNGTIAQTVVTGLGYLEGQQVSVIGDGFVVSSPNNQNYPALTVVGGQITLPQAYGVIHVGLPITADIETLNIDTAQGQSILDKQKAITQVNMWVESTRGLFVGAVPPEGVTLNALQGLDTTVTSFFEPKVRYSEGFSQPNQLLTRVISQNISGQWNSHGRVLVRQVDPLPAAILGIAPAGLAPVGM